MGAILVIPLVLVLVAVVAIALWVRRRADTHAASIAETGIDDPRERELEAIRRQHAVGTDTSYPTDGLPPLTRSEHGAAGQSGARVPYAEGAGKDADPLV